jgi:hypothetical protein
VASEVKVALQLALRRLDEQAFRFNEREGQDADRFKKALGSVSGRRVSERGEVIAQIEDLGLDPGIVDFVRVLQEAGVETTESCQGGEGHTYPEPTVRFNGDNSEACTIPWI